jgi:hypothetical protein
VRWLVLVLAACGTPLPPDAPYAFCTDQMPRAPTFANMQALFGYCTSCHNIGIPLDLTAGNSYANLVNKPPPSYTTPPVDESCGGVLVKPGDPAGSYLYQKLSLATPCAGIQMPNNELGMTVPLAACAQALVHDWIAAGAPEN